MSDDKAKAQPAATPLPLFYVKPEALNAGAHGTLSLAEGADYGFAQTAHAIPIAAAEMPAAMRSYPIVFIGDNRMPVAITGLRANENLFVEPDGRWSAPHYVPAYVRRYPFILAEGQQEGRLTLCIDRSSDRVLEDYVAALDEAGGGTRLFVDGQPSDAVKGALDFCTRFHGELAATRAMIETIQSFKLFTTRSSKVTLEGGEILNLTDFQTIDEAALNALPDADFLALRKSGALALIYCHLASSNSWASLVHQATVRKASARSESVPTRN